MSTQPTFLPTGIRALREPGASRHGAAATALATPWPRPLLRVVGDDPVVEAQLESAPERSPLRAPTLVRARPGRELVAPLRWDGATAVDVRVLGVAPALILDADGHHVTALLPGEDYQIRIGPVPFTGDLVIQLSALDGTGTPWRLTHHLILAVRPTVGHDQTQDLEPVQGIG